MKPSSRRIRRALWLSASAATVAVVVAGVTSSVAAAPASTTVRGPGYPPPKGLYAPFTNCPLKNPLMHESNAFTACTAGDATSGSIKIGNLTTPVLQPVHVQFGFWTPPNATYFADAVPPLAGTSALLVTKPDLIPEPLTTALGCPSANTTVENLCQKAQALGGQYNTVYALAEEAGPITNFNLFTWTQPVKFQLINPLLGSNCTIGTDGDPVVLNPQLSINTATFKNDPHPKVHPDTAIIETNSTASDVTFAAPAVTGCGPGGVANIAVDDAIDASAGLPAASGANSLTLTGAFDIVATSASEDPALPQPQDDAAIVLSAFQASTSGENSLARPITQAEIQSLLSHK